MKRYSRINPPIKGRYLKCFKDNWVFVASKKYLIINVGKDFRHHGLVTLDDGSGLPRAISLKVINNYFVRPEIVKQKPAAPQVVVIPKEPELINEIKYLPKKHEYCDSCKKSTKHAMINNELICTRCYNIND